MKHTKPHILVAKIYVVDFVFRSTADHLVIYLSDCMTLEVEMSIMGELSYFLGLQIKQSPSGMFVSQTKYAKSLVSKFGLESAKHARTPMSTRLHLFKDSSGI